MEHAPGGGAARGVALGKGSGVRPGTGPGPRTSHA